MTVPSFEAPQQNPAPEDPHFPARSRKRDTHELPRTLGREVKERYPSAVVNAQEESVAAEAVDTAVQANSSASMQTGSSVSTQPNAPATPATPAVAERDAYRDTLTHVNAEGEVRMVDVGAKDVTQRLALAEGTILMHPETQAMVLEDRAKKGDVLACARIAGIMASKRTSDLIPMCHPLNITKSKVEITPIPANGSAARKDGRVGFHVLVTCGVTGVTGIEMEALTAASVTCLTIYDMCKAVDRGMEIVDVRLVRKEGGRSGLWERADADTILELSEAAHAASGAAGALNAAEEAVSPLPGGPNTGRPAPAIAFVGYQNSGKTTLVEKIISRLAHRGLRVGSIKHHGHKGFDIDQPGKDSWRHAQAGSRHVGLISPDQYAEYARTEGEVPVTDLLARYTDVDVVIVEGYKTAGLPSIVVARSGIDRMRSRDSFELIDESTLAVACNDVVARDFRTRATRAAQDAAAAQGRAFNEGDVDLPPFLDINDSAAIASFVYDHLQKLS